MNPENWHWPQYIMASLAMINLLLSANMHGKPRTGTFNFFASLTGVILFTGFVLYSGGFWK